MSNEKTVTDKTVNAAATATETAPKALMSPEKMKKVADGFTTMLASVLGDDFDLDALTNSNNIEGFLNALLSAFFPDSIMGSMFSADGPFGGVLQKAEISQASTDFCSGFMAQMGNTPVDNASIAQAITDNVNDLEGEGAMTFETDTQKADFITTMGNKITDIYSKADNLTPDELKGKIANAAYYTTLDQNTVIIKDDNAADPHSAPTQSNTPDSAPAIMPSTTPELNQQRPATPAPPIVHEAVIDTQKQPIDVEIRKVGRGGYEVMGPDGVGHNVSTWSVANDLSRLGFTDAQIKQVVEADLQENDTGIVMAVDFTSPAPAEPEAVITQNEIKSISGDVKIIKGRSGYQITEQDGTSHSVSAWGDGNHFKKLGFTDDQIKQINDMEGVSLEMEVKGGAPQQQTISPQDLENNGLKTGAKISVPNPEIESESGSVTTFTIEQAADGSPLLVENGYVATSTLQNGDLSLVSDATTNEAVAYTYTVTDANGAEENYVLPPGSEYTETIAMNETLAKQLQQPAPTPHAPAPTGPTMDMTNTPQVPNPTYSV